MASYSSPHDSMAHPTQFNVQHTKPVILYNWRVIDRWLFTQASAGYVGLDQQTPTRSGWLPAFRLACEPQAHWAYRQSDVNGSLYCRIIGQYNRRCPSLPAELLCPKRCKIKGHLYTEPRKHKIRHNTPAGKETMNRWQTVEGVLEKTQLSDWQWQEQHVRIIWPLPKLPVRLCYLREQKVTTELLLLCN